MQRRIVTILIILAVAGYLINSSLEHRAEKKAKAEEFERSRDSLHAVVNEIVSRTNAISDWVGSLRKDGKSILSPVLTLDLEKVWLKNKPILFYGTVEDVSTLDDLNYTVLVAQGMSFSIKEMFLTELKLSLRTTKSVWIEFLDANPDLFDRFGNKNHVAVIAHVKYIESSGSGPDIKTGHGDLIGIIRSYPRIGAVN